MASSTLRCAMRVRPGSGMREVVIVMACMTALLSACANVQPQRRGTAMDDVPAAWSANADILAPGTTQLSQWWLRFDDPMLSRLIAQALLTNTSVVGAQASLRQARALRDVSAAALLPALLASASASAQHGAGGEGGSSNRFAAGLDARWELDLFGAQRSALAASTAAAAASAASLADVQVSICAEVAQVPGPYHPGRLWFDDHRQCRDVSDLPRRG
ncbi:TolC family protein [Massilia sp. DJPM01]|uniref:TolC family protein n=1 Tax=Massilia sp. DJPM01 TaxID=3024404 RepID=UPI00259E55C9|nr:TolC family protein [Massilia sp. DJPM01]MDM5181322.1 TolC family protein [Massilia sp. DJPM01]